MTIEQTVDIPASHRLTIDVPRDIPTGPVILTFTPARVDTAMEDAGNIWTWNRTHGEELRAKLQKLRGSLSASAFGGLDGVTYQRKVRDEWDAD
ncbi:hypothetical protein AGMMS49546_06590 [Spirochaetia bacterium]|nr:hypothetical protein AGMMS49546_06590 [Spirochaetia bacterium]